MHRFEIDATNPLDVQLTIDGTAQPDARRISFDSVRRQAPVLFVEVEAGGQLVGVGDVVVQSDSPEAIRAWLTKVNPDALEQAALAAEQASGGPMGPGQMFKAGMLALLETGRG